MKKVGFIRKKGNAKEVHILKRRFTKTLHSFVSFFCFAPNFLTYSENGFNFVDKTLSLNFKAVEYDENRYKLSPERKNVVNAFVMNATINWEPVVNINYWNPKLSVKGGTFKSSNSYYGIPYSLSNRYTTLPVFLQNLETKDGKTYYVGPSENYLGSDCSSAIMYAFKETVDPFCDFLYTGGNFEGRIKSFESVGDFDFNEEIFEKTGTLDIVKSNGKDKMFNSYKMVLPGDIILKHVRNKDGTEFGHVRMVLSVDSEKQTMVCADQTGVDEGRRLKGQNEKSTWQIDKTYTFDEIFKDGYIPLANKELLKLARSKKS